VTAPTTNPAIGGTTNAEATTEQRVRRAHRLLTLAGIHMSPAKVSRLIRQYQRDAASIDPELARVIAYADPTGETAVNNAMKARKP
jgi:hypothetical protein